MGQVIAGSAPAAWSDRDHRSSVPACRAFRCHIRQLALGRKNFLFVGHEEAGENIAGFYSLVSTCEAHGKTPVEFLTDVLIRIGKHTESCIDELLPDAW
jgi:hypothetical protein